MSKTDSKLDKHADYITLALSQGASKKKLAEELGVARSTLDHWLKRPTPDEESDAVSELEMVKAELTDVKRAYKKARTLDVQAERVLAEIADAVRAEPVKYKPMQVPDGELHAHTQALLLSDTHAGEVVDSEAMNGMNVYNWAVMTERMAAIQHSLLSFQANRPYPIHELQLWCLGDMLSGSNHQELAETNEMPAADQAFQFGMLLGRWIEELVPYYPCIKVAGVVGNHPRVSVKPANKQVFNNFDWMAYKVAEAYLSKHVEAGLIHTTFPRSGFHVAEIAGNRVLLFHGDGIRSSMPGVPWGGVTRRTSELKKQYAEFGVHLDGFALGHFHQANVVQGSVFMNGSVKGSDEYVIKNFGAGEKPTQLLLTYDNERGRLTDVSYINPA